jgi:hypothetical protein
MEILNKLTALSESLGMGKSQVEEVKSDVEAFGAAKFEEGKKIGYDEGFAAGVASVPVVVGEVTPPSDKVYSQSEMDLALIAKSNEVKAMIKAKYDEAQAKESAIEASVFAEDAVIVPEAPAEPVVETPLV